MDYFVSGDWLETLPWTYIRISIVIMAILYTKGESDGIEKGTNANHKWGATKTWLMVFASISSLILLIEFLQWFTS